MVGSIHPECIVKVSEQLNTHQYKNRLFLSVWHHNTTGLPNETHCMESRTLQYLLDNKFCIGLHGHQHKTEVAYEQFKLNSENKIVVFSAGSLCAGPNELPTGTTRQYTGKRSPRNLSLFSLST